MQNSLVHKTQRIGVLFLLCFGLLTAITRAETFHLTDGKTITGDIVSMDDRGIILKNPDGSYGERLPWTKVSQADLKDLLQNPKASQYVEPYIEPDPNEKLKRMEVDIKPVPHFTRLPKGSLIGAMFTSSLGIFTLLILYAANIYVAYEVSIFRAQKPGVVCGVSAVLPVLGPIIFLLIKSNIKDLPQHGHTDWSTTPTDQLEPALAAAIEDEKAAAAASNIDTAAETPAQPAAPALPPTKTFARGQFTFNRRFIESQFAPFFAMSRPPAQKDMVLTFKTARGTYIVQRISRISANDLGLQVTKGAASEEVPVPFVEIQEVQLKHKDA